MKWVSWIAPPRMFVLANGKKIQERRSYTLLILIIIALAVYWSIELTGFNLKMLLNRWHQFFVIIDQMIPPNWAHLTKVWTPLIDTIKMSLLGSLFGAVAALPAAMVASANIVRNRLLAYAAKILLSVLRTLPSLVTALIATYIFGLGTIAGTVAIFLYTVAYVGKLLSEQIENADMGPFEAMESLGMTRFHAFRHAVLPQVLPTYLSTSLFCFEGNVRYAAILGFVGAGGIGLLLNEGLGWRDYPNVGIILILLIVTVFVIERISEYFRIKLS